MAFTLPDLPYPHDALKPYMSAETLEFHHDKHHLAYVNNGNNALKGTEWEGKPLEEIVKGSFGKNPAVFNNAGQHYNHIHFWKWMKPNAGNKIPGEVEKALKDSFGSIDKAKEDFIQGGVTQFGSGWSWLAVKDGKVQVMKTPERRKPACPRREADPRRRRVGALLLHRLSQSPARLSQGVGRSPHQLGICRRAVRRRSKLQPRALWLRAGGRPALVGQVQRLLRTDVDVGRVHRLTVAEGSVQVDAAVEWMRELRRRVIAGLQRAEHFLPADQAAFSRLELDEIGLARVRHHHGDCGRALGCLWLEFRGRLRSAPAPARR